MSIAQRISLFIIASILVSITLAYFVFIKLDAFINTYDAPLDNELEQLTQTQAIQGLAQQTLYYDEVLTQSARNYAFTGDLRWKTRYRTNEKLLALTIKAALQNKDTTAINNFLKLSNANDSLISLELKAIKLVEKNQNTAAQAILEGDDYWKLKDAYLQPIHDYIKIREGESASIYTQIENRIHGGIEEKKAAANEFQTAIITHIFILLAFIALGMILLLVYVKNKLNAIKDNTISLQNAPITSRFKVEDNDEFGHLATELNFLLDKIGEKNQQKAEDTIVEKQKSQLERFGRELHDSLGIIISSMKLLLEKVKYSLKLKNKEEYEQFKNLINEAYAQVRELSNVPVPEAIVLKGLKNALTKLIVRTEMIFPIQIDLITNLEEHSMSSQEQINTYLIVRELLNNAIKHAQCEQIIIQIIEHDDSVMITFEDDGVGISSDKIEDKKSGGLANIKQRVTDNGGTINIDSGQGVGTTTIIEF